MKKSLLFCMGALVTTSMMALDTQPPVLNIEIETLAGTEDLISAAGTGVTGTNQWGYPSTGVCVFVSGNNAGSLAGEYTYNRTNPGNGNWVAANGMAVGNVTNQDTYATEAGVFFNGEVIVPASLTLSGFYSCFLEGITVDASMICGYYASPTQSPFVCNVNSDGTIGQPQYLPVPESDFFNMRPQKVSALFISNDGKVVAGMVTNGAGNFEYPIVYTSTGSGWAISYPTQSLFNPAGVVIPENPGDGPADPNWNYEYYMGSQFNDYLEALTAELDPDPLDYMTPEMRSEFLDALNIFKAWQEKYDAYQEALQQILADSPSFTNICLSADGSYLAAKKNTSSADDDFGGMSLQADDAGYIWLFDLNAKTGKWLNPPVSDLLPSYVSVSGDVIAGTMSAGSYICKAGSQTFDTFFNYVGNVDKDMMTWIENQGYSNSGYVTANADMNIFSSAFIESVTSTGTNYLSYIFPLEDTSTGVVTINPSNEEGIYRVYNLQGVKVMESTSLDALPSGLYIINGSKHLIR